MMTLRTWPAVTVLLLLVAGGCSGEPRQSSADPAFAAPRKVIVTTFYPTTYFAQRIVGDAVPVECPLPPDADPEHWVPDDAVVAKLQTASLVVVNGAGFEKWLDRVSLPSSRVVVTTEGLDVPLLHYEKAFTHQHGPGGAHSHEGIDGHTWLDPLLAQHQAKRICEAARGVWPEHAADFADGLAALSNDLQQLDADLRRVTAGLGEWRVCCSHPAYNYLARRYEFPVTNFDFDPATPLKAEQVKAVQGDGSKPVLLIWESDPASETLSRLGEAGVRSVVYRPAESPPASGDFLTVMRGNVARLRDVLNSR